MPCHATNTFPFEALPICTAFGVARQGPQVSTTPQHGAAKRPLNALRHCNRPRGSAPSPGTLTLIEWTPYQPRAFEQLFYGRCCSCVNRVSAAGSAQNNLTMTGFDFGDDLAELTLNKLLPYKLPLRSRRVQCSSLAIGAPVSLASIRASKVTLV